MWSPHHQCVFIHVPKTGGQSVESVFITLNRLSWKDEDRAKLLLGYNADPAKGPERIAHLTAAEYVSCGYLSEAEFRGAFKFAFVRNPWERLISEYLYRHYYKQYEFGDFIRRGFPAPSPFSDATRHLMPQVDYLRDANGEWACDFVGRFEALQAGFDTVMDRLGLPRRPLPHGNKSRPVAADKAVGRIARPNRRGERRFAYFDSETAEMVGEIYRADIEAFGYSFEGEEAVLTH